ncbi:SpaA isopeptide-forming pilin-related protein [Bifidobacterium boum]|uniref:SpaA isopeptide-forming pilin-related protein n=1 Tax=Bifidobacterium boum TaxID=78343 RepID=UPI003F8FF4DF
MRHQVEQLKHVAPKHGVKPVCALTAALVAVAMMATMAVTSLTPSRNANAADADNKAGIYKPTSVSLGTDTGVGTEDTGIATYVGGDMYVGQKVSGDMKNPSGPAGSYAAEAEGLTAVRGKLLLHPLKGVWTTYYKDADGVKNGYVKDYRGFRFGIVGFGSQYRPKDGSSVLEVRGENSDNDINWVGGAEAWGNAGWIGKDNTKTKEPSYTANIARDPTTVFGGSSNSIPGKYGSADTHKYDSRPSVYVPSDMSGSVNWNRNQNDDNIGNTGKTFSDFRTYINKLSNDLSGLQNSESVYVASAKAIKSSTYKPWQDKLVRTKYDGSYSFTIDSVNERVIQFEGNGTSSMQVFYLPATLLNTDNNTGYTGVSFVFKNIPDSSSVVINVTGDKGYKVDFHNGWRFWWTDSKGNTKELGGSYTDPDYAKRAQQIMWNFADASSVIIRGGQGSGKTTRKDANSAAESADGVWAGSFSLKTKDDPAAGMLGSILVPKGSFESHVSTNGRVWVGGNYAMYNPDAVTRQDGSKFVNYERSYSASALDMDQERHNLPWNGSYSTQGAAIAWDKVDASTQATLDNTTWAVYASKSDAQNQSNALKTVTDNAYGDDDSKQGSFSIGGLNPSATYYIREFSANNPAYATNTNIYAITAGGEGSTARVVTNVYDSKGNDIDITDSDKNLLPSAGDNSTNAEIANKKRGTIEWSKVDGTDKETLLGGSAWTLSKMSGETAEQSWNITDDQSGTEVKRITITDANNKAVTSDTPITFEGNNSQKFTATAYDQQNKVITGAKLTWSSDKDTVASVDQNGTVTPKGNGTATITVKSADGNVTASFTVEVSGVETSVSIKGYTNGQEISLEKGETRKLTASVAPDDNTVEWFSSAANVSLSATTGTSVTLTANSVTSSPVIITATEAQQKKTFTLKVNVTAKYLTLYFQAQNNWPADNVKVHYQTTNDTVWTDIIMRQMDGSCNNYAYANIPLTGSNAIDSTSQFGFKHINGKNDWYSPGNANVPKADNNNFKFTNNGNLPEVVVISAGPSYSTTAPSGCAVTSTVAYSSRRVAARSGEHRAVASVLRTQSNVVNVEENNTVSSKKDEDTAAGKFKVSDLADGTYKLQEMTAPNGYEKSKTEYWITITDGKASWSPGITDPKITNDRKTGVVTWTKMSSDFNNTKPLPGSQWTLKQTKTFSWKNGVAEYTNVTPGTVLAKVTDNCVNDAGCSTQTGKYADLDSAAGKFKIGDLAWGEYELIESKAPDGYNIDKTTPHTFRIGPAEGSDVTGDWYTSSSFHPEATAAYNEKTAFTIDGGPITNTPGVVLPDTGGEGLNKMYAAGFLAVAIAVAGLALSLRRRQ